MASEWRTLRICDIGRVVTGKAPSSDRPDYFGHEIPFLTPSDMQGQRIVEHPARLLVAEGVGVSCIGWQMGKSILIHRPSVTNQQINTVVPEPEVADCLFLYYALSTMRDLIFRLGAGGSRTPILNKSGFGQLRMNVPPLDEQRAIARILGSLDDKIELNRKMNRTLEEMARAIFKSWFVDFDPVRAKAEGRDTGLPPHIADLFPDSFEDSELGEIPKGWRVSDLGAHFQLTMGQSPPGDTYNESGRGLPFYQGRTDFGSRFPSRRVFCTAPTRFAEAGDTLVSVRAPVGDVNMASERCSIGRGVAASRHNSGRCSFTYYSIHHLKQYFDTFESEGTVFGCINRTDFERLPFVVPPPELITAVECLLLPLDSRIECNMRQSTALASVRDALLPKLISGEMTINSVKHVIGRCI